MNVYLIRHTLTAAGHGICYGSSDLDLSSEAEEHLQAVKHKLGNIPPESICISSPMKRCRKLAAHIFPKGPVYFEERLREVDFGAWELQPWASLKSGDATSWMEDFIIHGPPGGESLNALKDRTTAFWKELLQKNHPEVYLVCHGAVIRCLLAEILGLPLPNIFRLKIDFGSITQVNIQKERIEVAYINK